MILIIHVFTKEDLVKIYFSHQTDLKIFPYSSSYKCFTIPSAHNHLWSSKKQNEMKAHNRLLSQQLLGWTSFTERWQRSHPIFSEEGGSALYSCSIIIPNLMCSSLLSSVYITYGHKIAWSILTPLEVGNISAGWPYRPYNIDGVQFYHCWWKSHWQHQYVEALLAIITITNHHIQHKDIEL